MRRRPAVVPTEHAEQVSLFQWAALLASRWPELALLFAIPNGGHRHPATARKLKAEGVKAGVPDVCLPVARGGYHGLFVELKRTHGGRLSPEQRAWHAALEAQGYRVTVARGVEDATQIVAAYVGLPAALALSGREGA